MYNTLWYEEEKKRNKERNTAYEKSLRAIHRASRYCSKPLPIALWFMLLLGVVCVMLVPVMIAISTAFRLDAGVVITILVGSYMIACIWMLFPADYGSLPDFMVNTVCFIGMHIAKDPIARAYYRCRLRDKKNTRLGWYERASKLYKNGSKKLIVWEEDALLAPIPQWLYDDINITPYRIRLMRATGHIPEELIAILTMLYDEPVDCPSGEVRDNLIKVVNERIDAVMDDVYNEYNEMRDRELSDWSNRMKASDVKVKASIESMMSPDERTLDAVTNGFNDVKSTCEV